MESRVDRSTRRRGGRLVMAMGLRAGRAGTKVAILAAALSWPSCGAAGTPRPRPPRRAWPPSSAIATTRWPGRRCGRSPPTPIAEADLRNDGPGPFESSDRIDCRYQLKMSSAARRPSSTALLADGRVIKVKYGKLNAEPRTERAATRLLSTLGFGADRMYVVERVRCHGCPAYPHPRWGPLNRLFARARDTWTSRTWPSRTPCPAGTSRPVRRRVGPGTRWTRSTPPAAARAARSSTRCG